MAIMSDRNIPENILDTLFGTLSKEHNPNIIEVTPQSHTVPPVWDKSSAKTIAVNGKELLLPPTWDKPFVNMTVPESNQMHWTTAQSSMNKNAYNATLIHENNLLTVYQNHSTAVQGTFAENLKYHGKAGYFMPFVDVRFLENTTAINKWKNWGKRIEQDLLAAFTMDDGAAGAMESFNDWFPRLSGFTAKEPQLYLKWGSSDYPTRTAWHFEHALLSAANVSCHVKASDQGGDTASTILWVGARLCDMLEVLTPAEITRFFESPQHEHNAIWLVQRNVKIWYTFQRPGECILSAPGCCHLVQSWGTAMNWAINLSKFYKSWLQTCLTIFPADLVSNDLGNNAHNTRGVLAVFRAASLGLDIGLADEAADRKRLVTYIEEHSSYAMNKLKDNQIYPLCILCTRRMLDDYHFEQHCLECMYIRVVYSQLRSKLNNTRVSPFMHFKLLDNNISTNNTQDNSNHMHLAQKQQLASDAKLDEFETGNNNNNDDDDVSSPPSSPLPPYDDDDTSTNDLSVREDNVKCKYDGSVETQPEAHPPPPSGGGGDGVSSTVRDPLNDENDNEHHCPLPAGREAMEQDKEPNDKNGFLDNTDTPPTGCREFQGEQQVLLEAERGTVQRTNSGPPTLAQQDFNALSEHKGLVHLTPSYHDMNKIMWKKRGKDTFPNLPPPTDKEVALITKVKKMLSVPFDVHNHQAQVKTMLQRHHLLDNTLYTNIAETTHAAAIGNGELGEDHLHTYIKLRQKNQRQTRKSSTIKRRYIRRVKSTDSSQRPTDEHNQQQEGSNNNSSCNGGIVSGKRKRKPLFNQQSILKAELESQNSADSSYEEADRKYVTRVKRETRPPGRYVRQGNNKENTSSENETSEGSRQKQQNKISTPKNRGRTPKCELSPKPAVKREELSPQRYRTNDDHDDNLLLGGTSSHPNELLLTPLYKHDANNMSSIMNMSTPSRVPLHVDDASPLRPSPCMDDYFARTDQSLKEGERALPPPPSNSHSEQEMEIDPHTLHRPNITPTTTTTTTTTSTTTPYTPPRQMLKSGVSTLLSSYSSSPSSNNNNHQDSSIEDNKYLTVQHQQHQLAGAHPQRQHHHQSPHSSLWASTQLRHWQPDIHQEMLPLQATGQLLYPSHPPSPRLTPPGSVGNSQYDHHHYHQLHQYHPSSKACQQRQQQGCWGGEAVVGQHNNHTTPTTPKRSSPDFLPNNILRTPPLPTTSTTTSTTTTTTNTPLHSHLMRHQQHNHSNGACNGTHEGAGGGAAGCSSGGPSTPTAGMQAGTPRCTPCTPPPSTLGTCSTNQLSTESERTAGHCWYTSPNASPSIGMDEEASPFSSLRSKTFSNSMFGDII